MSSITPPLCRHIVLFKLKPEATHEQLEAFQSGLRALPSEIPHIVYYSLTKILPPSALYEGYQDKSQGHHWVLDSVFTHKEALSVYSPHPAHQKCIKTVIDPIRSEIVAIDYELTSDYKVDKKEWFHTNPPHLRHLVLWRLNSNATAETIKETTQAIQSLREIEGVADLHVAQVQTGDEIYQGYPDRARGVKLVLDVVFKKKEDLGVYMPHPIHTKAVQVIRRIVAPAFEVDFEL